MKYRLLLLVALLVGCEAEVKTSEAVTDHVLLREIYASDQGAREQLALGAQMTPEEFAAFARGDSVRRVQVDSIVALDELQTANDYHHASMIYQHGGDSLSYKLAHEMSSKAIKLDSTHKAAKWMTAASWDRYLISVGKPQWYGTQYAFTQEAGEYFIREIDTTKVDDADRARLGVPFLAEAMAYVDTLNAQMAAQMQQNDQ